MSRIFWDSNLFIYLFEGTAERAERVVELRKRMLERQDQLFTSALTLGEVLVKPIAAGIQRSRLGTSTPSGAPQRFWPLDAGAASIYAHVRCDRTIRAPDAIQLACVERPDRLVHHERRATGTQVSPRSQLHRLARPRLRVSHPVRSTTEPELATHFTE